ncbi:MAG: OmpP1/FadL family transporter [Halioglobus sp.]
MKHHALATTLTILGLISVQVAARPYPGVSGLAATADSALTAGTNPAGITRFSEPALDIEVIWFTSESEWESSFDESDVTFTSTDSGDTIIPRFAYVYPINDKWATSFTFLGTGFSEDFGSDWPGRYFIIEYSSVLVSAFPSLAYRINDQWSVAGSVAITYTSFEQERAIRNIFDPGIGDGRSELESDSIEFGFGLSTLYEMTDRTRFGLTYQSEIEPSRDADVDYSRLGPNTEAVMDRLGIIGGDLTLESTSPQSATAGLYHEWENNHAVTLDFAWIDFSRFSLSEYYFNGEAIVESTVDYKDIWAASASYTFPMSDRWMLGVSAAITTDMVDDEDRSITLRLDEVWTVGVGAEFQWTDTRSVYASAAYIRVGDAPVNSDPVPGVGELQGRFTSRDIWQFQVGVSFGGI